MIAKCIHTFFERLGKIDSNILLLFKNNSDINQLILFTIRYEEVYANIFKKMQWNRVVSLSEDGKHTEYINHLEHNLKENNIHMITTRKFPRDVTEFEMKQVNRDAC